MVAKTGKDLVEASNIISRRKNKCLDHKLK
jgi:hypothetical protein